MANQYTILDFGSTFEFVARRLRKEGYEVEFSCTYGEGYPKDLGWNGKEGGWEMRRLIKSWCKKHDVKDYKIVRNWGVGSRPSGDVYELWVKNPGQIKYESHMR